MFFFSSEWIHLYIFVLDNNKCENIQEIKFESKLNLLVRTYQFGLRVKAKVYIKNAIFK